MIKKELLTNRRTISSTEIARFINNLPTQNVCGAGTSAFYKLYGIGLDEEQAD